MKSYALHRAGIGYQLVVVVVVVVIITIIVIIAVPKNLNLIETMRPIHRSL